MEAVSLEAVLDAAATTVWRTHSSAVAVYLGVVSVGVVSKATTAACMAVVDKAGV
jgi:hypothetical protein